METQMEYLHMQMPIDGLWHNLTITGVPVTLTAIGTDGTVIDLGQVTTNGYYGTFSKAWTPPKEDTYTIIASFASRRLVRQFKRSNSSSSRPCTNHAFNA